MATNTSVSVPHGVPVPKFDQARINAAYEPNTPIHTTPSIVMAMFGIGPASTESAAMKLMVPAKNANASTSGIAISPTQ